MKTAEYNDYKKLIGGLVTVKIVVEGEHDPARVVAAIESAIKILSSGLQSPVLSSSFEPNTTQQNKKAVTEFKVPILEIITTPPLYHVPGTIRRMWASIVNLGRLCRDDVGKIKPEHTFLSEDGMRGEKIVYAKVPEWPDIHVGVAAIDDTPKKTKATKRRARRNKRAAKAKDKRKSRESTI